MRTKIKFGCLLLALLAGLSPVKGQGPVATTIDPPTNTVVRSLTFIYVFFGQNVQGVDAADLLINNVAATNVTPVSPAEYLFYFPPPPTGTVSVAWAVAHGITDLANPPNAFTGGNWTYMLNPNSVTTTLLISEFLTDNASGIKDEDGNRSDWIEIYNPGPIDANLDGWFLTDTTTNLAQWRFPSVFLGVNEYLLVWASGNNRVNPATPLHTNFKLSKESGYLALLDPMTNVVSEFAPYPQQQTDISYGRDRGDPNLLGYFTVPTPRAQNSTGGVGFVPEPVFSLQTGIYTNSSLTLTISAPLGTIRYTLNGTVPTNGSPVYTNPIIFGTNVSIKARVFPPVGNLFPSAVVGRNFIFLDSTAANFTSRLPTLIISTEGRTIASEVAPGGARTKGSFVCIDTYRGQSSLRSTPEVQELAEFEYFGQTSLGFPKQPIRIEIQDSLGNDLDRSLLGMPADSDWRLRNPYNDKTMLNDFLGFQLWEKMGHYSVRRKLVEVFRDTGGGRLSYPGDYYGVMVLAETIKVNGKRVEITKVSPQSTNEPGYIIKRDKDSPAGDLNFTTPGGGGFLGIPLKLHEPKPNEMRNASAQGVTTSWPGPNYTPAGSNQMGYLTNFLRRMETALYAANWLTATGTNHYSYYLDSIACADQMLHVEFTKQIDGYRLSDYWTKDRDGKLGPGPVWDWNLSYGNANYLAGGQTNGWYYEAAGQQDHLWPRRLITGTTSGTSSSGDPDFVQLIADRWAMFRTNVLNGPAALKEIDDLASLLSEAAARDLYGKYRGGNGFPNLIGFYTWPNPDGGMIANGSTGSADSRDVDFVRPTNYLGSIETRAPSSVTGSIIGQMKKWVLGRYLWMDNQFTQVPTFSTNSGMVVSGSTVVVTPPPGSTLYYTLDGTDPRASGGAVVSGAFSNNGPVTITVTSNIQIVARARSAGAWKGTYSAARDISLYTAIPPLRLTEIMYHPANPPPGVATNDDHFEYLEFKNIGATPLNVNRFRLRGGVDFDFPNQILAAGESAVIVRDVAVFQSRYGSSPRILGAYTNDNLGNDGDRLVLEGGYREAILDFRYDDKWYPTTDGQGFSLQIVNETAATGTWGLKESWRPSGVLQGTPGANDPGALNMPAVYVNEALTHTDPLSSDAIELHNPNGSPADISNWYLTDDFNTPKKYRIPEGTSIPANGYIVFYQSNSFGSTNLSVTTNSFALSSKGDEVYVFSADAAGNLTGWTHGFDFGAQVDGATFGRYVISTGEEHFVTQTTPTLGGPNSGPQVGPVVISEINYHPPDVAANGGYWSNFEDEYIELQNISSSPVKLYDPLNPTNTWRLRDSVSYTFPTDVVIPAGGFVVIVGFDPANTSALNHFLAANNVTPGTPVYGPWDGQLDNSGDNVELVRPDLPDPLAAGFVAYVLADNVHYQNAPPWPSGFLDGFGFALGRVDISAYGDDPANWLGVPKSPGMNLPPAGSPPVIVSQPVNTSGIEGQTASFSVTASGPSLGYQWVFDGRPVSSGSGPVLFLTNLQLDKDPGTYFCYVFNSAGAVASSDATLLVRQLPRITQQPTNRAVWIKPDTRAVNTPDGTNVTFTVDATSVEPPILYQWRFNGTNIPGATSRSLLVTNVQVEDEGDYYCVVSDGVAPISSTSVHLTPLIQPIIVQPPLGQTVVEGSDFSHSIEIIANPMPAAYSWRRALPSGTLVSNYVSARSNFITLNATAAGLVLTSGVASSNYELRVVVFNEANLSPGVLVRFTNIVVADFDRDGIPDVVENNLGLDTNNPTDAALDADGDGMSNRAEYVAGTDPTNAASYLKISSIAAGGGATLTFGAISNKTYTIQYTEGLGGGTWARLKDLLAARTNRTETVFDPAFTTNRYYRVATPYVP